MNSKNLSVWLFAAVLLLCATLAESQALRWDLGAPGSAGAATLSGNGLGQLLAVPGAAINWCNYPANATPCTNYATTYTGPTASATCPSNTPIVLQGSSSCVATGDNFGNLGLYTASGTYAYTLTANGVTSGPFIVTIAAPGGGGGGGVGDHIPLDNCTPDTSGNLFYSVLALSNNFNYATWQALPNTTTTLFCTMVSVNGFASTFVDLQVATADNTAGHTATLNVCWVVTGAQLTASPFTCAGTQTFTTTTSAYGQAHFAFTTPTSVPTASIIEYEIQITVGATVASNLLIYPTFI